MVEIPSILKRILDTKAQEVAEKSAAMGLAEVAARAGELGPVRGFAARLKEAAAAGPAVIAEIKKASPSAGVIRVDFDPAQIAMSYESAGAACLSVLTDRNYFQGRDAYLEQVRQASSLPVLRKEFIVYPWQVYESRLLGADCILLIVAALSEERLRELGELARSIGLDVLVEVHDEDELEAALTTGAGLIGVNNRDLHSFTTDLATSERLRPLIPKDKTMVTESGIRTPGDVARMREAGVDAFLVGEAFMRADDPGAALRELFFSTGE